MDRELIFTDGRSLTVGTMYCIGQNYAKHAKEMGGEVHKDPVVFIKPPAAYIPSGGKILLPDISSEIHHEVELVIVIGNDCENVERNNANEYIAGVAVGIDVTLRDIQKKAKEKGTPWAVAKGFKTSAPISKVVPISEIANIADFELTLAVNGIEKQHGFTRDMERPAEILIEYISKIFSLRAGDCIFTGTPEGVGPIRIGDRISAEIKGVALLEVEAS